MVFVTDLAEQDTLTNWVMKTKKYRVSFKTLLQAEGLEELYGEIYLEIYKILRRVDKDSRFVIEEVK